MKIKNEKLKLSLIGLGVLVAVSTPAIIIGSIYAYNSAKVSPLLSELNKFYNSEKANLFNKLNFRISAPAQSDDGKFYVKNLILENVIFEKKENLKNYSYNIEITSITPNESAANFTFDYMVSSLKDPAIKIRKTSEVYSEFTTDLGSVFFSK